MLITGERRGLTGFLIKRICAWTALANIAPDAAACHVGPTGRPAQTPQHHMVDAQFMAGITPAAVLASVLVPHKMLRWFSLTS